MSDTDTDVSDSTFPTALTCELNSHRGGENGTEKQPDFLLERRSKPT